MLSSTRQALGKHNIFPTLDFETESAFELPTDIRKTDPVAPQIVVNPSYNPFQSTTKPSSNNGSSTSNYSTALKQEGFGALATSPEDWQNFYSN